AHPNFDLELVADVAGLDDADVDLRAGAELGFRNVVGEANLHATGADFLDASDVATRGVEGANVFAEIEPDKLSPLFVASLFFHRSLSAHDELGNSGQLHV